MIVCSNNLHVRRLALMFGLISATLIITCGPADEYELVELPPLPGDDESMVFAINDADPVQAVGVSMRFEPSEYLKPYGAVQQAVRWTYDAETSLIVVTPLMPDPQYPWIHTAAFDVNNDGVAVGAASDGHQIIPMRWINYSGKNIFDLDNASSPTFGQAYAVDDMGSMVGRNFRFVKRPTEGYLFDFPSITIELKAIAKSWWAAGMFWETDMGSRYPALFTKPRDSIVRLGVLQDTEPSQAEIHDMIYRAGTDLVFTSIGMGGARRRVTLRKPDVVERKGFSIVGASPTADGEDKHGVIWRVRWPESESVSGDVNDVTVSIGHLQPLDSGTESRALGLNHDEDVVGWSNTEDATRRAVMWSGLTDLTDLNDRLPSESAIVLSDAQDINNRGEIVANGATGDGSKRAYLMLPTNLPPPEPPIPEPDFSLNKAAPLTVAPEATLIYTFTIFNDDESGTPHNYTIVDPLPVGTEFDPADNAGWTLNVDAMGISWLEWTGTVAPPWQAVELKLRVTAPVGEWIENVDYTLRNEDNELELTYDGPELTRVVNQDPSILLTHYVPCPFVSANTFVRLMAEADDPDGSVANVAFFEVGETDPLFVDDTDPYEYTIANVADGTYDFWAVATDEHGAATASNHAIVRILNSGPQLPSSYAIEELPLPPEATYAQANDISNRGVIVGYAGYGPYKKPCLWVKSDGSWSVVLVATGEAEWGEALAVNDLGAVCGYVEQPAYIPRPVLFEGAAPIFLHPGESAKAVDINDDGRVLIAYEQTPRRWSVYEGTIPPVFLGTPVGGAEVAVGLSGSKGLNSAGQVAGRSRTTAEHPGQAFRWTPDGGPGVFDDLSTLGPGWSGGNAINDLAHVVGTGRAVDGTSKLWLWTEGSPGFDLGQIGPWAPSPRDLTPHGVMVGEYSINPVQSFVGLCDVLLDVRDLVDPSIAPLWDDVRAKAINDVGEIVGSGRRDGFGHAIILTPVFE